MPREGRSMVRRGVVAGVAGAAIVALWFLGLDLARGRRKKLASVDKANTTKAGDASSP